MRGGEKRIKFAKACNEIRKNRSFCKIEKIVLRKIQIKNIGPLEDTGVIYIKPMMLIIGKQSMGKSTFMKVLCFCEWLEKKIFLQ